MQDIRIGLAQINCPIGQVDHNVEKHRQYARRAAKVGARIICFPELSLTGYPHDESQNQKFAQPLDGEVGNAMLKLSEQTGLLVLAGLLERDQSNSIYNTHLVASPGGLLGTYRKTHVSITESDYFDHGDQLPVFSHEGITFGIQICYDNHFPEAARTLALRGAEVIFSPYGSPGPCTQEGLAAKRSRWLRYLTARAFDNSLYYLVVNQVGKSSVAEGPVASASRTSPSPRDTHSGMTEYPGGSMALGPWGEVIYEAQPPVENLAIVDLTAAMLEEKRHDALQFFDRFRRPELYSEVVQSRRAADR